MYNHVMLVNAIRSISSLIKMPLKFSANISMMFPELPNVLDRYSAAKKAGFEGVEVAFPYQIPIDEIVKVKEKEQVQQVLLNAFPGRKMFVLRNN